MAKKTTKTAPEIKPMEPTRAIYHAPGGDQEVTITGSYKGAFGKIYLVAEGYDKHLLSDKVVPIQASNPDPMNILTGVSAYDPDAINQKQAKFEAQSSGASVYVIHDEWDGQLQTGKPFDDAAAPYQKDNPDKEFRFLSERDSVVKARGRRGYSLVKDPKGEVVRVGGMPLGWIPKEEAQRRQAAKLQLAEGMLDKVKGEYAEAEAKAARDAGISYVPAKLEDEVYQGANRIE